MKMEYKCTSRVCRNEDGKGKRLVLPAEMVMDDRNIAVMYCPVCKKALEPAKPKHHRQG